MKWILSVLCAMSLHFLAAQELKQVEVESFLVIEMPADDAWAIVKNWSNLNQLVPKVVKSTTTVGEGWDSSWEIFLHNGKSLTEKMVYFSESERKMSYIMTETPMPIEDYTAVVWVEPKGLLHSEVYFYTRCKTSEENYATIVSNFKGFQETYLSNIKKVESE